MSTHQASSRDAHHRGGIRRIDRLYRHAFFLIGNDPCVNGFSACITGFKTIVDMDFDVDEIATFFTARQEQLSSRRLRAF